MEDGHGLHARWVWHYSDISHLNSVIMKLSFSTCRNQLTCVDVWQWCLKQSKGHTNMCSWWGWLCEERNSPATFLKGLTVFNSTETEMLAPLTLHVLLSNEDQISWNMYGKWTNSNSSTIFESCIVLPSLKSTEWIYVPTEVVILETEWDGRQCSP